MAPRAGSSCRSDGFGNRDRRHQLLRCVRRLLQGLVTLYVHGSRPPGPPADHHNRFRIHLVGPSLSSVSLGEAMRLPGIVLFHD
jgi:hypothetical protein